MFACQDPGSGMSSFTSSLPPCTGCLPNRLMYLDPTRIKRSWIGHRTSWTIQEAQPIGSLQDVGDLKDRPVPCCDLCLKGLAAAKLMSQ